MSSIGGLGSSLDKALLQLVEQTATDTVGGTAVDQAGTDSGGSTPATPPQPPASSAAVNAPPLTGTQQSLLASQTQSALIEIQATLTISTAPSDSSAASSAAAAPSTTSSTSSFKEIITSLSNLLSQIVGKQPANDASSGSAGDAQGSSGKAGSAKAASSSGGGASADTVVSTEVTFNPDGTITTTVINSDGTETITVMGIPNTDQPAGDSAGRPGSNAAGAAQTADNASLRGSPVLIPNGNGITV